MVVVSRCRVGVDIDGGRLKCLVDAHRDGVALAFETNVGKIVGQTKGPKINGFTYKNSTTYRRRYGHRQKYHMVEITSISAS